MRAWGTTAAIAAVLLLLAGCGDDTGDELEPMDDDGQAAAEEAPVEDPADAPAGDSTLDLGDTAEVGDLEVTVSELVDPSEPPVGWEMDGRWVSVSLEVVNGSADQFTAPQLTFVDGSGEMNSGDGTRTDECQGLRQFSDPVPADATRAGCQGVDLPADADVAEVTADVDGELVRWLVG